MAFYPEAVEAAISVLSSWVQQDSMVILFFKRQEGQMLLTG